MRATTGVVSRMVFFAWGEVYSLFPATCTDIYGRKFATTNYGMLYPELICAPKGTNSSAVKSACAKLCPQGWPQLSDWSLQVHRALAGIVGWSRAPCKVVNRHIPVIKADAQRVTEAKAIRRAK